MMRKPYFLAAAASAFTLALVSSGHAAWYFQKAAASSCKAIRGLPQVGYYGELWTNPSTGPYGDTYYGGISCFYDEPLQSAYTGQALPRLSTIQISVYDGDSRTDPYHTYDFSASACLQDYYGNWYGCSATKYPGAFGYTTPTTYGMGTINFSTQYYNHDGVYGPDLLLPYSYYGKTWADTWINASKIMYINMPASSTFYGWLIGNGA